MKRLVSCTVVLLLMLSLHAQQRTVTGLIRDEKGNPIPFATITVQDTKKTSAADGNGSFSIAVTDASTLRISSSGFNSITVDAGSDLSNIVLKASGELQEVVVTALGQQRQAKELGYSTVKVKATELTQGSPVNIQNGLTAKVSGLNINTTNNGVFANTRITLRGIRSLTGNNQPMLVLDGVPVSLAYLNSINPNDVADITILKSSSSTAIYGPDGVNGAIVVTTKKGVKGRPSVNFGHSVQWESISYMPKFQTQFGSGYNQNTTTGYGEYDSIEQQSWGPAFDGIVRTIGQPDINGNIQRVPYSYVKNGRRNFFNTGLTNQTDLSYSTGDYYVSAQNVSIKGVMPGDENNRRTITFRADKEYGKFRAAFHLRYTQTQYDITTNNSMVYYGVTSSPGQIDLGRYSDWRNDYFASPDGYFTTFLDERGKTPYFAKDNWRENGRSDDFFGNAELNFKATNWLTFTYRAGITIGNGDSRQTRGAFSHSAYHRTLRSPGAVAITSAVTNNSTFTSRFTSEIFANVNKQLNRIGVGALVGQTYREIGGRFLSVGSNNLGTSTLYSIAARRGEAAVGVENSKQRLERYFGKLSIDFDKWIFLEATASYDIDSRLVKPNSNFKKSDIAFFYPGVSTSILLHEIVPFIKNSDFVSYAKLRGAISKTGNVNLPAYAYENVYDNGLFFPYGSILGYQAAALTVANSYKPEFVVNKEVGIELGFMRNRINFEANYYTQDNTDQVIDVALSSTTGYTSARVNAASFVNRGIELDLKLTPLVKINDVSIDFKINYTNQSNKVYSLVDGVDELGIGNANYIIVGESAYKFKLTDYLRDDQGRVIVSRETGMPTLNPNLTTFGNTMPEHLLGLSLSVNWKGLNLTAVADYRGGNQILADQLGGFMDDNGISWRSGQHGRRAFIFPNSVYDDGTGKYVPNTDVYTEQYGRLFWNTELNTGAQSNYLANGALWKIREIALNYDIPVKIFGPKVSSVIKGATIGINGRNLFMFLPKSNLWTDPEFSASANSSYTGNAVGRSTAYNMPPTRLFGANLQVRF